MRGPDALTIECPCCGGHTDHDALSQTITGEWVCGPCCDELADRGALNDTAVEALSGAA